MKPRYIRSTPKFFPGDRVMFMFLREDGTMETPQEGVIHAVRTTYGHASGTRDYVPVHLYSVKPDDPGARRHTRDILEPYICLVPPPEADPTDPPRRKSRRAADA